MLTNRLRSAGFFLLPATTDWPTHKLLPSLSRSYVIQVLSRSVYHGISIDREGSGDFLSLPGAQAAAHEQIFQSGSTGS